MLAPEPGVVLAGPVKGGALAALYAKARLLAYVPLAEGFGLPPVEAMTACTPVVASPLPSTQTSRALSTSFSSSARPSAMAQLCVGKLPGVSPSNRTFGGVFWKRVATAPPQKLHSTPTLVASVAFSCTCRP